MIFRIRTFLRLKFQFLDQNFDKKVNIKIFSIFFGQKTEKSFSENKNRIF